MPTGFAVEDATSIEVVAAWTVPQKTIPAQAASPGWRVLGEYFLPKSCAARLDVVHLVSSAELTSRVRLWDTLAGVALAGAVSSTSLSPERTLGGRVTLAGNRTYQVQAECTGAAAAENKFGVVLAGTITD